MPIYCLGDGTVHKPLDDRTNDPEIVGASACLSNVTKSQSAGSAKSPLPSKTGSSESVSEIIDHTAKMVPHTQARSYPSIVGNNSVKFPTSISRLCSIMVVSYTYVH